MQQDEQAPSAEDRVQWVYAAQDAEQLERRYDAWAADYDADLEDDFGYVMPRAAAEAFSQYAPTDAKVLDAGSGTGLVGVELRRLGYRDIHAMDMSRGMLDQARAKGVYAAFHRMVMGEALALPTNSYDATICVGALTVGHAPAHSLDELARVTRPGGHIVFTLRPDIYESNGFRQKHQQLTDDGKWEFVATTERFQGLPKGEPDVYFQIWTYKVAA